MEFNERQLCQSIHDKAVSYLFNPKLGEHDALEYHRHGTAQLSTDISTELRDEHLQRIKTWMNREGYLLIVAPITCGKCAKASCLTVPWGRTIPFLHVVQLQPHLNNLTKVHTLAHELSHVLDDDEPSELEEPKNEVCAELFAYFYCDSLGLPVNLDDTLNYCAGYAKTSQQNILEGVRKAHNLLNRTGILTNATH